MQKDVIDFVYRKCMYCKYQTKDMLQDTCKCGRYMYAIGNITIPNIKHTKEEKK